MKTEMCNLIPIFPTFLFVGEQKAELKEGDGVGGRRF